VVRKDLLEMVDGQSCKREQLIQKSRMARRGEHVEPVEEQVGLGGQQVDAAG
jgi:hypothetical protein